MKWRHQRSTLTTCCNIAAAEVGHHGDAAQLCQQGRVVELQGVTRAVKLLWPVAHGLAMSAYGFDRRRSNTALRQQGRNLVCVQAHQTIGGQCGAVQFVICGGVQGQQFGPQSCGHGRAGVAQHPGLGPIKVHQNRVHPVQRGA